LLAEAILLTNCDKDYQSLRSTANLSMADLLSGSTNHQSLKLITFEPQALGNETVLGYIRTQEFTIAF
jgi:hypothetical protein